MIPTEQNNRVYVIINSSEVSSLDFSQIEETSKYTLRYNLAGTQTIVKFTGETTPSFLIGKTQYTHDEINTLISDPINGWYDPEDI